MIEITRVPRAGDAPVEGAVVEGGATGQARVIMGPGGGTTPMTNIGGLASTSVDSAAIVNTGVITTGLIVTQPLDDLAGQPVDGLAQLAAVVADPVVGVPVVTAKKSAPVLPAEESLEQTKVN